MNDERLLCLGYGYVADALARRLKPLGWRIAGTAREPGKFEALAYRGVAPVAWRADGLPAAAFEGVSAILVSTPPGPDGCPALAAAADRVRALPRKPRWIGYLSSNGVYGDHAGAWVDEGSTLRPSGERGRARVRAEADWTALGAELRLPVVIFRLPGIYGPGRSALDQVRDGTARRIVKPGQVFSRAHVDDIAAALQASLENPAAGDVFNVADDEPAPPQDVVAFACRLLGVEPPPEIPFENARLSGMAASFYADNKRVSNKRMKSSLGVVLQHPTYREGLAAILAAEGHSQR